MKQDIPIMFDDSSYHLFPFALGSAHPVKGDQIIKEKGSTQYLVIKGNDTVRIYPQTWKWVIYTDSIVRR
ncbi:MAG: hypothetical protein H6550_08965 [Chitinophagales bacterium]|nr:hypothetical protein [Chitinophagales bacterium]